MMVTGWRPLMTLRHWDGDECFVSGSHISKGEQVGMILKDARDIGQENVEMKFATLDLKSVTTDGTFEGYASVFGREDLARDVVMRGAFHDSLRRRGLKGVKLLFQHDPGQPIGVWDEIREDAKGLFVKGRLMLDVARAREVLSLMVSGALDGLSIGFRTVEGQKDRKTGRRFLHKIDLWEISIVTFPMMPDARISSVEERYLKSSVPTERTFERWLTRDAGFSRSQARMIVHSGFKSLKRKLDAADGGGGEPGLVRSIEQAAMLINNSIKGSNQSGKTFGQD